MSVVVDVDRHRQCLLPDLEGELARPRERVMDGRTRLDRERRARSTQLTAVAATSEHNMKSNNFHDSCA